MKLLFLCFEVDNRRRTLVGRGNASHMFQYTRHFVQLGDLGSRDVPYGRPELFIFDAYQPWTDVREGIEHELVDINCSPIVELPLNSISPLARPAGELLKNGATNRFSGVGEISTSEPRQL